MSTYEVRAKRCRDCYQDRLALWWLRCPACKYGPLEEYVLRTETLDS